MMTSFWKSIGTELGKRWLATIFVPAFMFWVGGLIIFINSRLSWAALKEFETYFLALPAYAQAMPLIGAFVVMLISGALVRTFANHIIRFLEGYWPAWLGLIRKALVRMQRTRIQEQEQRWQELANKDEEERTSEERSEFIGLDWRLKSVPESEHDLMPSRLGNILKASETRPRERYGIDPVICWPRLWLVLPDSVKKELGEARAQLDTAAQLVMWSILFAVWAIYWPWALLITAAATLLSYRMALQAAAVFGELVESTYDTHRHLLYQAARWPLPTTAEQEKVLGEKLTRLFLRGEFDLNFTFVDPTDDKK